MIEKWCKTAWNGLSPSVRKLSRLAKGIQAGVWIILLVAFWFGTRTVKGIYERYASDRNDIANAVGSTRYFFGLPHPDPNGSRILYLGTSEAGFAVTAVALADGKPKILHEWRGENSVDSHDQVSSFSPGGSLLAYYYKGASDEYVAICDALTGKEAGRTRTRSWNVTDMAWLTPEKLVCVGRNGWKKEKGWKRAWPLDHVYLVEKVNNQWKHRSVMPLVNSSGLEVLSDDTVARVDARGICAVNIISNSVAVLFAPRGRSVAQFDYCEQSRQFLVTCKEKEGYSLWRLRLNTNAPDGFTRLTQDDDIRSAKWLNAGKGWA